MSQKFSHILAPLDLGFTKISNRIIMGSMHTGLEEERDYQKLARFYQERAAGGVGMIVTGGIAPNFAGSVAPFAATMTRSKHANKHRVVTDAVHQYDTKILLQILHTGRYAFHPFLVAPSSIKARINKFTPWKLTQRGIYKTIKDFVNCAQLARQAGYDGIEIMGSEGYLINQFIAKRTNQRTDSWGGSFANRIKFALTIVRSIREALGSDFIIMYRLSMLDLVEDGSTFAENIELLAQIEQAGANIVNTGIGWHEARVPTIATLVPRMAFSWVTAKFMEHAKVPLVTSNRINNPVDVEQILAKGEADLVSMARPLLADPNFVQKIKQQNTQLINKCIACNQACLDNVFKFKQATCMVNPRAGFELEHQIIAAPNQKSIAVIGAGPAGLACATTAAMRGHKVTIYESSQHIGGQFNISKLIPGKREYQSTIDYFSAQIKELGITLHLNHSVTEAGLNAKFDAIVLSTGISPRLPKIEGIEHPKVSSYLDVFYGDIILGKNIVIIGAGGIGFDTAAFLLHQEHIRDIDAYLAYWGVDKSLKHAGGLINRQHVAPKHNIIMMQRKEGRFGANLGKTTAWAHRMMLQEHGVQMLAGVTYDKISDAGIHITYNKKPQIIDCENIIICAGQEANGNRLSEHLHQAHPQTPVHIIGGARTAGELDAVRAIAEGDLLARKL